MIHLIILICIWLFAVIGLIILWHQPTDMKSFQAIKNRIYVLESMWIMAAIITTVLLIWYIYSKGFWKI